MTPIDHVTEVDGEPTRSRCGQMCSHPHRLKGNAPAWGPSIPPQCYGRGHPRRPCRRNQTSTDRNCHEDDDRYAVGREVEGRHSEEHSRHGARCGRRPHEPEDDASGGQRETLPHDELSDFPAGGAPSIKTTSPPVSDSRGMPRVTDAPRSAEASEFSTMPCRNMRSAVAWKGVQVTSGQDSSLSRPPSTWTS